nr:PRC-barrel domain-containing protein [Rhizomicrobium electricum]
MSKIIAALALTALPAMAQDTPPATPMAPPSPSANADLTGQRIYNTDGDWIGTVTRMGSDTQGQPLAAVTIERKLGIAGTTVLFPMGSLQPREKGGYMTNLNGDQIKQLPKSNATNTP